MTVTIAPEHDRVRILATLPTRDVLKHRGGGERLGRGKLGRRVRRARVVGVTQQPAARKPLHHARVDALQHRRELGARRRGRRLEAERLVGVGHVNAVDTEEMEVDVHVEARAGSVHPRHRAHRPHPGTIVRRNALPIRVLMGVGRGRIRRRR